MDAALVMLARGDLSRVERIVVLARYQDECSWAEIGAVIGQTPEAAERIHDQLVVRIRGLRTRSAK